MATYPPAVSSKLGDQKFCRDCGEVILAKAEICPKCGVRQMAPPIVSSPTNPERKSKLIAGLLALLLGGIGIHKFYLERPFQGLLYLLLCWTLVPALFGFIEGLNYLSMSQRVFDERYNQ